MELSTVTVFYCLLSVCPLCVIRCNTLRYCALRDKGSIGSFVHILESRGRIGSAGFERFSQPQPWLPQGLAAATVPGAISVEL
jgi:hypothetical protein